MVEQDSRAQRCRTRNRQPRMREKILVDLVDQTVKEGRQIQGGIVINMAPVRPRVLTRNFEVRIRVRLRTNELRRGLS